MPEAGPAAAKDDFTGGCLCGDLRIRISGPPLRVGLCHRLNCRKHHSIIFYDIE